MKPLKDAADELASVPKDAITRVLRVAREIRNEHAALVSAKEVVEAHGLVVTGEISGRELAVAAELEMMACERAQQIFGFSHMGGTEEDVASLRQFLKHESHKRTIQ
jgi:peroxiredoxin family protein